MNWKEKKIGAIGACLLAGCSLAWGASARAQTPYGGDPRQPSMSGSPTGHAGPPGDQPADPMESAMAARNKLERNIDRQKHLEMDTQRLLQLANELQAEVANSGMETMTPEMLRKMDEIEKLARSVKDKMRD